jgi:hypothetical protein
MFPNIVGIHPVRTAGRNACAEREPALILHVAGFYGAAAAAERPTCGPVHELVQQVRVYFIRWYVFFLFFSFLFSFHFIFFSFLFYFIFILFSIPFIFLFRALFIIYILFCFM